MNNNFLVDEKILFLFSKFINNPSKTNFIIKIIQYDFSLKINQPKIYYNFDFIIKYYLSFISNKKLKLKKKFIENEQNENEKIINEYKNLFEKNKKDLNEKLPYKNFLNLNSINEIINNDYNCSIFFNIILHFVYFYIFIYNKNYRNFYNLPLFY